METIGTTFKNIREERKLLLEDVTQKTGINKTLLSRIENGKRLPTREQINELCKYYKAEKNSIIVQWLSDKLVYEVQDEGFALQAMQVAEEKIKYITNRNEHTNNFVLSLKGNKQKRKIGNFVNKVIQGDCLEVMQLIPDKSVDMILCDLPYGTTQNKWDSVIDLDKLWAEYDRIVKDNGAIVLTSQGVFTAKLILSNEKSFKYKITWIKSKSTNFLNAKKQPLRKHEDICVFYKKQPTYNPQMTNGEAYDKGIRKDQYTGSYGDFKPRHVKSNGKRYPNDVVFYEEQQIDDYVYVKTAESEGTVYHPTQKPIELGRYLIKTFTKPGDIVLDNACGSGSFLLSAILENRNFIGIEKNEDVLLHKVKPVDYIKVCTDRIEETLKTKSKILFYLTLSENLSGKVSKLELKNNKDVQKQLNNFFNQAKKIDYQAVFESDFTDNIPFNETIDELLFRLVAVFNEFDFKVLPTEVIGYILENLVPQEEKQKFGQYFTSETLANLVAFSAIKSRNDVVI